MRQLNLAGIRYLILFVAGFWSLPLGAAGHISVHWEEVCSAAKGDQLVLTTDSGATIAGFCYSVDVDEIAIYTKDHKLAKIARSTLSRIQVKRTRQPKQLRSLRKNVGQGLKFGWETLASLSGYSPAGIVIIPGTLAWGAVAAPFCVAGDLRDKIIRTRKQEIRLSDPIKQTAPAIH